MPKLTQNLGPIGGPEAMPRQSTPWHTACGRCCGPQRPRLLLLLIPQGLGGGPLWTLSNVVGPHSINININISISIRIRIIERWFVPPRKAILD